MNQENTKKDRQAPAIELDDLIFSIYLFFKKIVITLYDLTIHPAYVSEEIKNEHIEKRYLKPFTFLVLISFVFVTGIQVVLVYWLILLGLFKRVFSGAIEGSNIADTDIFPELSEFLVLPSIFDILQIGVPIILIIIVFSSLFYILISFKPGRNYTNYIQIGCYVVGYQMFIVLALVSIVAGLISVFPITSKALQYIGTHFNPIKYSFILIITILILWPGTIFSKMIISYVQVESRRIKSKWLSWFVTVTVATLICTVSIVSSSALAYPLAKLDVSKRSIEKTLMHAAIIKEETEPNSLIVMITNNSDKYINIRSNEFRLSKKINTSKLEGFPLLGDVPLFEVKEDTSYHIVESWPGYEKIMSIASNESVFFKGRRKELKIKDAQKTTEEPVPDKYYIILNRILPTGITEKVNIELKLTDDSRAFIQSISSNKTPE